MKNKILFLMSLMPYCATAIEFNLTPGVTEISRTVYSLHMTIFYICCVIGVIVFSVMFYALFHHRKSKGVQPATFHESLKIEILWTIIPFIILIAMAIPATSTLLKMEDASESDLTVIVTASQWKWHYQYFNEEIEFYSVLSTPREQINNQEEKGEFYLLEVDKPLVVPINKKIRFLMTSDDVIHSWWVRDFAVKKDANPGFINETWTKIDKPGVYRGQCAELCGKDHAFMPIVVEAVTEEAFENWLVEQKAELLKAKQEENASLNETLSLDELMAQGKNIYLGHCAACHQPTGKGIPGVFPALEDSPIALGDVNEHIDIVLHGVPGTAMQSFAKQLSLKDIAAVITYERNAWGNNTNDAVQINDIANRINK